MATVKFTTTNWENAFVVTPTEMGAKLLRALYDLVDHTDSLDIIDEDRTNTTYREEYDNGGVLVVNGSGFDTDVWQIRRMTYSEPSNQVSLSMTCSLRVDIDDSHFSGHFSNMSAKFFGVELGAKGDFSLNDEGSGSAKIDETFYKVDGTTVNIAGDVTYANYAASGTLSKVTVTSAQGESVVVSHSSKLTAPLLDSIEGQTWEYFLSESFLNGSDQITGGSKNDSFGGFAGNDTLFGGSGSDTVNGGSGNDSVSGETGNDALYGTSGNDTLDGGSGNDTLDGGGGNDVYVINTRTDLVSERSGEGTDLVRSAITYSLGDTDGAGRNYGGNVENLRLTGSSPINGTGNGLNNVLYANNGANQLDGGAGNDTVSYLYATRSSGRTGVTLNLSLLNASGQATASGVSGSDRIKNIENITGSNYNDTLTGNSAANVLSGGSGNDNLSGGAGNDNLAGGAGNDSLSGGAGNDNLLGGTGRDRLNGGSGRDTFDFNALSEMGLVSTTRDVITDFARSQDRIDLSTIDANTARSGNQSFSVPDVVVIPVVGNHFPGAFTRAGELYFDPVADVLYGNTDADAAAEFSIQITGLSTLSATDFIL